MPETKRRPIGHWRDPSTGQILEVYDPNLPHGEREEEERQLLDEIERKRQSDPELRLKRLRERKGRVEEERKRKTTVLFPICLDDAVIDTNEPWAAKLRADRHIGDFTNWRDHDAYQKAFERLLRDLRVDRGT